MSRYKILFGSAAAGLAAVAFSINASAISAGMVDTKYSPLTVRSLASVSASSLTTLPKGSLVTLLSKAGEDWWYVKYNSGSYGYCHSDYIMQLSSGYDAYVDIESGRLNVRSAPSTSAQIVTKLEKGSEVVVLSESGGWSRALYNGTQTGYIYSAYLSKSGGEGGSSADSVPPASGQSGAISLSVPKYKQYDSRWANLKVGYSGKTMSAIGCVTTALAMTESHRLGDSSITPASMLYRLSYNSAGDVFWPSNYIKFTGGSYLEKTLQLLESGKPVIFGAKNYYGRMHWVVVTGYNGRGMKSENFLISDPGSENRSRLSDLLAEYPYFYKIEYYV